MPNVYLLIEFAPVSRDESEGNIEYWFLSRVTRLAEFSPNVRVFTFSKFLKITEVAHIFVQLFQMIHYFLQKWAGVRFGQFSLQTNLVTLVEHCEKGGAEK
jgi:hypothetical protein